MSYASTRFASALITAAVGVAVGVGALTLGVSGERWVAFGGGCAAAITVAVAFLAPRRGAVQRILDLPGVLTAAWLIVASRAIEISGAGATAHSVKWLDLSAGAALCGIGTLGLLLHEAGMERDLQRLGEESWAVRAARHRDDGQVAISSANDFDDALSRTAGR